MCFGERNIWLCIPFFDTITILFGHLPFMIVREHVNCWLLICSWSKCGLMHFSVYNYKGHDSPRPNIYSLYIINEFVFHNISSIHITDLLACTKFCVSFINRNHLLHCRSRFVFCYPKDESGVLGDCTTCIKWSSDLLERRRWTVETSWKCGSASVLWDSDSPKEAA